MELPVTNPTKDQLLARIVRLPAVCAGEATFAGTRVTLRTVLASLADGDTAEEIIAAFPTVQHADVQAAIMFAAESAREDLPARAPLAA